MLGPNGTGKTTLMRLLSGVLPLWSGRIRFAGAELGRLAPDRRARLRLCQLPEGRGIFQTLSREVAPPPRAPGGRGPRADVGR